MLPENATRCPVLTTSQTCRDRALDEVKRGVVFIAREAAVLVELKPPLADLEHVLDQRPVRLLAGVAVDRTVLPVDI